MRLSPELASICNSNRLTRTEAIKKVWVYIKSNELQDSVDRKLIVPDATFSKAFGSDSFDMFQVAKRIQPHFVGKAAAEKEDGASTISSWLSGNKAEKDDAGASRTITSWFS